MRLSPSFDPPFTGAHWECVSLGDGAYELVSAGAVHGRRYLDGRTQDGFVHTVGDGLPPFSGTRWHIQELSPGVVTIKSLGDFRNPAHQFLDGVTQEGRVGLAPHTNQPFSGTKWRTIALPRPSFQVQTRREQTGSTLTLRGTNFSPNDDVRFSAEGIIGHGGAEHAPFAIGGFALTGGNGAFETSVFVDFVPTQPADIPVMCARQITTAERLTRSAKDFIRDLPA
jgi:hypothetical protein